MDVRVGLWRKLSTKELMLLNCVVGRLLRVPWTARRSNQSILKISPGCSLEGMMLKLKLQYFGHLMLRVDSLGKTLMLRGIGAGGEGDNRGWDGWMASPTRWTWVWVNFRSWCRTGDSQITLGDSQKITQGSCQNTFIYPTPCDSDTINYYLACLDVRSIQKLANKYMHVSTSRIFIRCKGTQTFPTEEQKRNDLKKRKKTWFNQSKSYPEKRDKENRQPPLGEWKEICKNVCKKVSSRILSWVLISECM